MKSSLWQKPVLLHGLQAEDIFMLLSPIHHPFMFNYRRAQMLIHQVHLFALLFVLITPLLIAIDMIILTPHLWLRIILIRASAAFIFYLLHKWQPRHQLTSSFRAIARLCAISMMVNIGSQWFLQHEYTYAEYPVMMLASLAAFPLTLLESLLLVVPTLIGLVVSNLLDWQSLWLLTILSVVASVASASQLSTIIVLVKQASYDSLTGVLSRRSGEEMLNMLQTNSNHQPLSVVFLTLTTLRKSMTPTDTRWETQCCVRSPGNYRTIFDLVMWWSVGVEMSFWC